MSKIKYYTTDVALGVYHKDEKILKKSSSGGVAYELCKEVLLEGGIACCAIYNYSTHQLQHEIIRTVESVERARGSKYIQSELTDALVEAEEILKNNPEMKMLLVGTPCQCAAAKRYLEINGVNLSHVYFVDIICHGVGSPRIWKDYISSLEHKIKKKICSISFKDKRNGWLYPYSVAVDKDGAEHPIGEYTSLYNKSLIMRPSCHHCKFAQFSRVGDLTIGDFWNIQQVNAQFYNSNGVSCVFVNTEKGAGLFEKIKNSFLCFETTPEKCRQPNLNGATVPNETRMTFWMDYRRRGINYIVSKYASTSFLNKAIRYVLVRLGVWQIK